MRKNGERFYTNIRQIMEYLHKEQHSSKLDTEELYSLFSHKLSGTGGGEEDLLRLDKDSEAVQIMIMHSPYRRLPIVGMSWQGALNHSVLVVVTPGC